MTLLEIMITSREELMTDDDDNDESVIRDSYPVSRVSIFGGVNPKMILDSVVIFLSLFPSWLHARK